MLTSISFLSCDDNDNDEQVFQVTVASVKLFNSIDETLPVANNKTINNSKDILADFFPSFYVKYENKENWEILNAPGISGFNHEEGYEYVLRIKSKPTGYACPEIGVSLVEEISKVQKDSENLPMQVAFITVASQKTGDESNPYYIAKGNTWIKFPAIEGFESVYEGGYQYEVTISCKYNGVKANPKYSYETFA